MQIALAIIAFASKKVKAYSQKVKNCQELPRTAVRNNAKASPKYLAVKNANGHKVT
jgi:hypothetical protein